MQSADVQEVKIDEERERDGDVCGARASRAQSTSSANNLTSLLTRWRRSGLLGFVFITRY